MQPTRLQQMLQQLRGRPLLRLPRWRHFKGKGGTPKQLQHNKPGC